MDGFGLRLLGGAALQSATQLFVVSCAAYSSGVNPPVAVPPDAVQERPAEQVRIYTASDLPGRPYLERGRLELSEPSDDRSANLDRLRQEGGERACDGLIVADDVLSATCIVYSASEPIVDPAAPGEPTTGDAP